MITTKSAGIKKITIDNSLEQNDLKKLLKKRPWLKEFSRNIEHYMLPAYYNKLLKEYIFKRKSDLTLFREYLQTINLAQNSSVLELGCGSGRATAVALSTIKAFSLFDLVDLSPDMISHVTNRFKISRGIKIIQSDNINYLRDTKNKYDLVYSLWSLSHSIHQHLVNKGFKKGSIYVEKCITSFIKNNVNQGGKWFIIHFDSQSDEQKILMKQWSKNFLIFRQNNRQSPSKILIDKVLNSLNGTYITRLVVEHFTGDPIVYSSLNELLEIFLNFHMEMEYNRSRDIEGIIKEISQDVAIFSKSDGTYCIRPGCFIYSFERL